MLAYYLDTPEYLAFPKGYIKGIAITENGNHINFSFFSNIDI